HAQQLLQHVMGFGEGHLLPSQVAHLGLCWCLRRRRRLRVELGLRGLRHGWRKRRPRRRGGRGSAQGESPGPSVNSLYCSQTVPSAASSHTSKPFVSSGGDHVASTCQVPSFSDCAGSRRSTSASVPWSKSRAEATAHPGAIRGTRR